MRNRAVPLKEQLSELDRSYRIMRSEENRLDFLTRGSAGVEEAIEARLAELKEELAARTTGKGHSPTHDSAATGQPVSRERFTGASPDLATDAQTSARMSTYSALSEDHIGRMPADAERDAEEDGRRREDAEVRSRAETLICVTEKVVSEHAGRITEDLKSEVNSALAELRRAYGGADTGAISYATQRAVQVSQKMDNAIYAQFQEEREERNADSWLENEDVIEAEIVDDVDDTQPTRGTAAKQSALSGHAFLSYARENSLQADWLQEVLETAGIRVWRDTADLWPGEDWREKIREAIIKDTFVFLACFSTVGVSRKISYQNAELALAIEQMQVRRPGRPWLIPIRFDDCDIPDLDLGGGRSLSSIQRADLFGERVDVAAARLVTVIQRVLQDRT